MQCSSCSAQVPEGSAFCLKCGAHLEGTAVPATPLGQPPMQPLGQPQMQPPGQPQMQPPVQPQMQPPGQPPQYPPQAYAPPSAPPPRRSSRGLIIAVLVIVVLAGAGVGGYFLWKSRQDDKKDTPKVESKFTQKKSEDINKIKTDEAGYDTAEAALEAAASQFYGDDWYYYAVAEETDSCEYVFGPTETQLDKGVIVARREDGAWVAADVYTVDWSQLETQEPEQNATAPEEEAAYWLEQFIIAMAEGRGEDAYAMTTSPLADEAVPEDLALPGILDYQLVNYQPLEDGSFFFIVALTGDAGQLDMGITMVPGADAWYVASLEDATQ